MIGKPIGKPSCAWRIEQWQKGRWDLVTWIQETTAPVDSRFALGGSCELFEDRELGDRPHEPLSLLVELLHFARRKLDAWEILDRQILFSLRKGNSEPMEHQVIAVGLNDGDSYAVGGLELDRFGKLEDPPVGLLLFWRNRPAGFGILIDRTLEGPTVLLEARFERSERDLSFLDLAAIDCFDEDLQFVDDKVRVGCIESQALA